MSTHNHIIFFDGVCNLCNGAVNFIIDRDPGKLFKFAPLQSEEANIYLSNESYKKLNSIVYYQNGKIHTKSSAALRIGKRLAGPIKLVYVLLLVPPFIRNIVYDFIARNRYKWFGKKDSCRLPEPEIKERFLKMD